ncbi:TRAP transporter small permease subunit [Chloroflexota bacterium]
MLKRLGLYVGQISSAITLTNRIFFSGAALLILGMAFSVGYEVISRYVFNKPTIWATEVGGYLFVATGFLAAAYVVHLGGHIRVDIIVDRFPAGLKRAADAFTLTLAMVYSVVLCWQGWNMAWRAYTYDWHASTPLGTPIFFPMLLIPIGGGLLCLQLLVSIYGHVTGRSEHAS